MADQAPPTAQDAARRALILWVVFSYPYVMPPPDVFAGPFQTWSEADQASFVEDMRQIAARHWSPIRSGGLWPYLSPNERILASTPAAAMTMKQVTDAVWRQESLVVLQWALGLRDTLPAPDTKVDGKALKVDVGGSLETFLANATFRNRAEIEAARDTAQTWHWRSRTRELMDGGMPFPFDADLANAGLRSFDDVVRWTAQQMFQGGEIAAPIDGDFPVRGKAYRDLTNDEWSEIRSITLERHFALNWLCGYAPGNRWDETPTET